MAASPETKIVKKASEGYDRPAGDQELPIDINYQKLSEWLTARQKLPADWHKRVQAIQAKISEAMKELPSGTLAQLPGGTEAPVDYFRAVAIRDKLAETAERTLFGGLAGQAGIWDKIVKAYENGGVFIGEAAQTMVQNVDYEIPYLRKQMAKCSQQLADADRRHGEYIRAAASCAANYKKECEKLGIAGVAVSSELRQLSSKLPGLFEALVEQLRQTELDQAISYYRVFTQYAHSSSSSNTGTGQQQQQQQQYDEASLPAVLPVLLEIRQKRTAPFVAADAANNSAASAAGAAAGASIDWGGLGDDASGSGAAAVGGVDWGLDLGTVAGDGSAAAAAGAGGGISWDLGDSTGDAAAGISWDVAVEQPAADEAAAASGPSLDWDIDMSGIGVESSGVSAGAGSAPGVDWGIDAVGAAAAAATASGDASSHSAAAAAVAATGDASCQRLQADPEYRSQVLDDLMELRAFLVSRASGLSGGSSSGDLLRALAPDVVASTDAGDVRRMLAVVEGLIAALNDDDQLRQLLMISSSSRYLDRLHSNLQRKAGQEAKMLAAAAETQARQHESRATLAGLQPKLAEIVSHTRSIKRSVEAALSKQFNGRRVNVLGEINNALSASA